MPKVTDALSSFLRAKRVTHNNQSLLDRWSPDLESQVNVIKGRPVDGKDNTYTDGHFEWHPIRIPKNANSDPTFVDYELRYPFDDYAEGIGTTWWNFTTRKSIGVGIDIDSFVGHAEAHARKLEPEQMERVKAAVAALPYVEVIKSTGGNGLHLYVFFAGDGIPTANHNEHAALGRAVRAKIARDTGFDLVSASDTAGQNMWIWHRKMTAENGGLSLIKAHTATLSEDDLPGWRDEVELKKHRATVSVPKGELSDFEELASARKIVPLDDRHRRIIDALAETGYSAIWKPEHHALHTHTLALKQLGEQSDLKLLGFFDTASRGSSSINCFMFPIEHGAWKVYRFGQGVAEAPTWTQNGEGWTWCYFNRRPDLKVAAQTMGGTEGTKGFEFTTATQAMKVVEALGEKVTLDEKMGGRETVLKSHKDGRLLVHIERRDNDVMPGWSSKTAKLWTKIFDVQTTQKNSDLSTEDHKFNDPLLLADRHLAKHKMDGVNTFAFILGESRRFDRFAGWVPVVGNEQHPWIRETIQQHFDAHARKVSRISGEDTPSESVRVSLVNDVFLAIQSQTKRDVPHTAQAPFWLEPHEWKAEDLLVFKNGILNLGHYLDGRPDILIPVTPRLFFEHRASFDFDSNAPTPTTWLAFLDSLGRDADWRACLQEIMGYCLWSDYDLQKLFSLTGPPRSGKGTITRVMEELV